jgi:hypothetical protein
MTTPDSSDAAIAAIKAKHQELVQQRKHLFVERASIDARITSVDALLADCAVAARLFGVDLPSAVAPQRAGRQLDLEAHFHAGAARADLTVTPKETPPPPSYMTTPTIREMVMAYLKNAGPAGSKAGPIRRHVESVLNRQVHYKTVGMTLYRLAQEKLVHREGLVWSLVWQWNSQTKEPGDEPPGPEDDVFE